MRSLIYLLTLFVSVYSENVWEQFEEWKNMFDFRWNSQEQENNVFENWKNNNEYIREQNAKNLTYRLGHNHLSGLNQEEYRSYLGWKKITNNEHAEKRKEFTCLFQCIRDYDSEEKLTTFLCAKSCFTDSPSLSLSDSINWVEKGAVTPVKDQGQCGSCWSFSATGALEGAYFIKYGTLVSFSEQELVDCENIKNGGKDHGCKGGLMDNAFTWIHSNPGLCSEKDYPYTSGTTLSPGKCSSTCESVSGSTVNSFVDVEPSSDESMMAALSKQPVSIAIEADQRDFQLYKSGVFSGTCGQSLDHGVLVVGYGSEEGNDFYLIKNSWSSNWGEEGYIKLARGPDFNKGNGQCGMLLQGSYPVL